MKKISIIMLCAVLLVAAAGCTSSSPTSSTPSPAATTSEQTPDSNADTPEGPALSEPIAESPALLTSAGQSADFEMVKLMLEKTEIEHSSNTTAKADIIANYKTLIVVIGGSSKGLGFAGISADEELERVNGIIAAAEENDVTIIAMHIGGFGRRGALDDMYIDPVMLHADYAIVVSDGNQDGIFTTIAEDNSIPIDYIETMTDSVDLLSAAFK